MIAAHKSKKIQKLEKNIPVEKMEESDEEMSDPPSETGDIADEESDNGNSSDDEKSIDSDSEKISKLFANPGWADAMSKILKTNKPKKKKTLVLSRAKKISEVKPKPEKLPFQIEGENGEIKEEVIVKKSEIEEPIKRKKKEKIRRSIHVKPSPLDRPREKILQSIATKGVVQFFNAVKEQQETINKKLEEAGPVERKREKVLKSIDKRAFLDVLMGGTKSILVDQPKVETKKEEDDSEKPNKMWNVLRDDFVMGAALKDWDKKLSEEDEDTSEAEEMDSD